MIQFSTTVTSFAICRTFSFGALLSTSSLAKGYDSGPLLSTLGGSIDDKKEVKFQLDSGATANLISKSYLSESTEIENSDHTLTMYNQFTMRSFSPPLADLEYNLKFACNATWWFIEVAPLR
jgi:hypothetical protein